MGRKPLSDWLTLQGRASPAAGGGRATAPRPRCGGHQPGPAVPPATELREETGAGTAQAGIQPSSAELAPAGPHPTFRLKMPPSNLGTKCARKHIACGLPVQLGSTLKALVRIKAPTIHVLAIRKQAFSLRVKRHRLSAAAGLVTAILQGYFTPDWWKSFLLMHYNT